MSDHLALDESEQNNPITLDSPAQVAATTSTTRTRRYVLARFLSNLLSPAAVSIPTLVLVALYHASNIAAALGYALIVFIFLSIGPTIYIVRGVRRGEFTDVDVSLRTQRNRPFLFGISSAVLALIALYVLHAPKNLQTIVLMTLISGIIMFAITLWWKISIHTSALAGSLAILTVLYGTIVLPAFILLIALCWSRIVLRRHTLAQVIAGSLVSSALALTMLAVRGT